MTQSVANGWPLRPERGLSLPSCDQLQICRIQPFAERTGRVAAESTGRSHVPDHGIFPVIVQCPAVVKQSIYPLVREKIAR